MVMMVVAQAGPAEPTQCCLWQALKWGEVRKASMIFPPKNLSLSEHFPFRGLSEPAVACVWPVTSTSVCPRPPHCPEPQLMPCTSAGPVCLVLLGKEFQGSAGPGQSHPLCSLQPVPRVSLNKSQRLPCLAGTRAVCFFHMVWVLCLYFRVFLPFLCVWLKTESLPTQENCSDALKRVWIPFWKTYSKFFQSGCWWEGQNQQNNDSKYSSWGRNFCLYNLESNKIQETSQRTPITFQCVTASGSDSAL